MYLENISGLWTGTIILGDGYANAKGKNINFMMEIKQDGKTISGTAWDTGGYATNLHPAKITGKFEGNKISFTKQYSAHHFTINGVLQIDESRPGPEIYYTGKYDNSFDLFDGAWTSEKKQPLFGIRNSSEFVGSGKWLIKRKPVR